MFGWTKDKDKTIDDTELYTNPKERPDLSQDELKLSSKIENDFQDSQSCRMAELDDTGYSIEDSWEDDYYMYKGGGLQWLTNFAYRSKRLRQIRPNSEDNFIFNSVTIQHANITASIPEVTITGQEASDEDVATELTCLIRLNDTRNEFGKTWKRWVYDFITSGPTIAMVTWDNEWMGGRGPNRWVGDIRVERCDKWDMYFDPAITDLETRLQDCSYIIRRPRKKLRDIRSIFPERGKYVAEQTNEDDHIDEGSNPEQAYVIEHWHRGFPHYMPKERAKKLREKAARLESEGDFYKAQDYYDAAKGDLEGVHVAYMSDGILLEYCPYEFEDGLYPFVFTTRFTDDKSPWGFGEIRNVKIPQIMHNKADEIEMEAMAKEGLGGGYFQNGTISPRQLDNIITNSGKGGMWFPVDDVNGMKDRTGVKVPTSITNYKEHKQRMIETLTQITPIQQGMSPGSNMPFKAIQELGNRTDIRMEQAADKLKDFLINITKLRINRIDQFYTEDRYYRITGNDGKIKEGTFNRQNMEQEWPRETVQVDQTDPTTGEIYQEPVQRMEKYIPEFDVKVTILSEKPTDRNYYTSLAMELYGMQLLTPEDLLYTLDEGKLPPTEDILQNLREQNATMAIVNQVQQLPPELQQQALQTMQGSMQPFMQYAIPPKGGGQNATQKGQV
jgi:hypothetical protein